MSRFGLSPFGTDGPFGGPGLFSILGLIPAADNEVVAVFDAAPKADDPEGFDSATNRKNWDLQAVDPTIPSTSSSRSYVPTGEVVPTRAPVVVQAELVPGVDTQVRLYTDAKLEPRVRYTLEIQPPVRGDACETFSGPTSWGFRGLLLGGQPRRYPLEDRYRDWANEFFPEDQDQPEATWTMESSRDIALHDSERSLRKRVLRRLLSLRSAFVFLPGYGLNPRIKALIRPGMLQQLVNAIPEQVGQEPDVLRAAATAEEVAGGVVLVQIFVQRREGRDSRFVFGFPLA